MYRLVLIFIVLVTLGGYLYFSKPEGVVLNEKGKVEGLVNKGRALVQGNKFWKRQLTIATGIYDKDLEPHLPSSNDMQTLYNKMREYEKALDEKMKPLFTPEEQLANSLRIQADSIYRAGKWRIIDEADEAVRLKEINRFKLIIPIIRKKLNIKESVTEPVQQNPGTTTN
jgi:hypothetical protein